MSNENAVDEADKTIDWEARALKAENKIVSMKQEAKAAPKEEDVVKKEEPATDENKEEDTGSTNEDNQKQKQTTDELIQTAVQEALAAANVENTNAMNLTGWNQPDNTGFEVLTPNAYDNLSEWAQAEYMAKSIDKFGELELTFWE